MVKKDFNYPVTPETLHKYAAGIFSAIKRGECASTIWVPMAGRRIVNKFLIGNLNLFETELPKVKNYIPVYIEPLDLTEENLAGYLRLIGKSFLEACSKRTDCKERLKTDGEQAVFSDESATYPKLLEALKSCLKTATSSGLEVILFLGEFDELSFTNNIFYNNLKSLWDGLKPKLHLVFLLVEDITSSKMTEKLGELNAATLQNVIFVPISPEDSDFFADRFGNELGRTFTAEEKKLMGDLCGGHPYLIKSVAKAIVQTDGEKVSIPDLKKIVLGHYEPLSVAKKIFDMRSEKEKSLLRDIVVGKNVTVTNGERALEKLGLIQKVQNGEYVLFGELFKSAVSGEIEELPSAHPNVNGKPGLTIDNTAGTIVLDGKPIEEKFTRQEYLILKLFLSEPSKLYSRDDIGDVLWGKQAYDKYSDWAIDQLISKLRKKLEPMGVKDKIVTVKGRGYKITQ